MIFWVTYLVRVMIGRGHLAGPCPALSYVERAISF
jgi:hypothetical protein